MQAQESGWLLLAFQLPPRGTALRVRVWRRLQAIGAVSLKTSLYALPPRPSCREDFEWLLQEIRSGGGEAALIAGRLLGGVGDDEVRRRFVGARELEYAALAAELRKTIGLKSRGKAGQGAGRASTPAALARARRRLAEIESRDYFAADGREAVAALLRQAERMAAGPDAGKKAVEEADMPTKTRALREALRGKTWATRAGVQVDRMACAWLVRGWVDPAARFRFVADVGAKRRPGEVRFDMLDAEFTHEGDACSFEVMLRRLGLGDPALVPIAEIVHDLDLKDGRYRRPEGAGIAAVLAGICRGSGDDRERIERAASVFDGLYRQFGGRSR